MKCFDERVREEVVEQGSGRRRSSPVVVRFDGVVCEGVADLHVIRARGIRDEGHESAIDPGKRQRSCIDPVCPTERVDVSQDLEEKRMMLLGNESMLLFSSSGIVPSETVQPLAYSRSLSDFRLMCGMYMVSSPKQFVHCVEMVLTGSRPWSLMKTTSGSFRSPQFQINVALRTKVCSSIHVEEGNSGEVADVSILSSRTVSGDESM